MHRIRSTRVRLLVLPIAALFALGACGDGDDEGAADDASRESSEDATRSGDEGTREGNQPNATTGSGEIVIGGTTYAFTSDSCAIGTDDVALFEVTGTGSADGRDYEVEIARSQPADNYVERAKLAWSGVEASVATKIGPEDGVIFEVEDGKATASGVQFTGAGGAPSGEGTISIACDQS